MNTPTVTDILAAKSCLLETQSSIRTAVQWQSHCFQPNVSIQTGDVLLQMGLCVWVYQRFSLKKMRREIIIWQSLHYCVIVKLKPHEKHVHVLEKSGLRAIFAITKLVLLSFLWASKQVSCVTWKNAICSPLLPNASLQAHWLKPENQLQIEQ